MNILVQLPWLFNSFVKKIPSKMTFNFKFLSLQQLHCYFFTW